jgi:hypothetical protein
LRFDKPARTKALTASVFSEEMTPAAPATMNENHRWYRLKRLINLCKSAKSVISFSDQKRI